MISKEFLQDLYFNQNKSIKSISIQCGKSTTFIRKLFKQFNIVSRTTSDYKALRQKEEKQITRNASNKCLNCGKPTAFNKHESRKGFNKFCCTQCRNDYKVKSSSYYNKISNYAWLYNERIVLKKSKDAIAEELGCSTTVVNKWIKQLSIPEIRYNESSFATQQILNSKDELEKLYIEQKLSGPQIAKIIGSSTPTVSAAISSFDIPRRNSNEYPRKINKSSSGEKELLSFIQNNYSGKIVSNDRSVLCGRELDVYLPDLKIAFEFNGVFYHNDVTKDKNYHLDKTIKCQNKGIQLIHITDIEWESKKDVWKYFILNKLNIHNRRIFARKCVVKEVSVSEKNLFLDNYHIQGRDKSSIKLGLYYCDELVALMTFKASRFNSLFDWELVRFVVVKNDLVIGGFSKLLKYFIKLHPNESIISYADRSYSNGNVYERNGFKLISVNEPSYRYYDNNKNILIHRMNATKQILSQRIIDKGLLLSDDMSEYDMAKILKLSKVFNCGTLTYVYNC